jgi:hypothetical protein
MVVVVVVAMANIMVGGNDNNRLRRCA